MLQSVPSLVKSGAGCVRGVRCKNLGQINMVTMLCAAVATPMGNKIVNISVEMKVTSMTTDSIMVCYRQCCSKPCCDINDWNSTRVMILRVAFLFKVIPKPQ